MGDWLEAWLRSEEEGDRERGREEEKAARGRGSPFALISDGKGARVSHGRPAAVSLAPHPAVGTRATLG